MSQYVYNTTVGMHKGRHAEEPPICDSPTYLNEKRTPQGCIKRKIAKAIIEFSVKGTDKPKLVANRNFDADEAIERLKETQDLIIDVENEIFTCTCAISGLKIDLFRERWAIDHIDPRGGNDIDNFSIARKDYNKVKSSFNYEELNQMCEQILKYRGVI